MAGLQIGFLSKQLPLWNRRQTVC